MENNSLQKKSALNRFFAGNSYCWLSVLCTAGLMMLVYYCYNLFPFGETTILRMDLYHQYGPLFAEFYDRVTHLKSFIYSWNTGLGSPWLGNYFNYLSSPSSIIMLILGHSNMPEAIAGMILTKAALAAGSFTYYLKKSQDRHDFSTAAFGILYAMSGYFVAYYWNVMWIDAMVYFPLVMFGIERIINRRKPSVYIVFLALTLLSNYYMGYMTCIFSVIYFIVYFFSNYDFGSMSADAVYYIDHDGNRKFERKEKIKANIFLRSGFTFAFSSVAAACLVAFSLIPTFIILRSCSATSGSMPQEMRTYFTIFDFLANHLASLEPTIRSSGEDVLPNVYCGIGTLILVPLYIFSKRITLKEKIAGVFTLGLLFFSFNVNYLNFIWHGFHFPNDLPYRFSFMYCFLLLVMAYKAYRNLNEYTGKQLLGVGVAVVMAVVIIQKTGSKNVSDTTVLLSVIFAVTYCLIFYLLKDIRKQKSAVSVILLCCVIAEIACANTDNYSMTQIKSTFTSDYGTFRTIKDRLDEKEKGDTSYRMELTYNRARMDPAWFGYNGVSTFSSMAYEKMSNMQSNLGMYSNYINSYTYYVQTPVYNMMNSIKYIVDNDPQVTVDDDFFTEVTSEDNFTAYKSDYWLPIAFNVDSAMKDWYSGYTNPFSVQGDWFELATGVGGVFEKMDIADISYFNIAEIDTGFDTGDIYFSKIGAGTAEMTVYLSVPETQHCYLFVDSDNFDQITITKGEMSDVQETDEPYIYDVGIVEPDQTVEVLIKLEEDSEQNCFMNFYPYYINEEALNSGYEILNNSRMNIESFEETKITGTVSAGKDCITFTSIPYDKGWTVKIDGKEIKEDDYIALGDDYLCFNMPHGVHSVEISFSQRGLLEGAAISCATLLILLIVALFFKKKRPVWDRKYKEKCEKAQADHEEFLAAMERARLAAAAENLDIDLSEIDMNELTGGQEMFTDSASYPETAGEDPAQTQDDEVPQAETDEKTPEEPEQEIPSQEITFEETPDRVDGDSGIQSGE